MKLSIVLPCYNPPAGWEQRVIAAFRTIAAATGENPELIIVDDGNRQDALVPALAEIKAATGTLLVISYDQNKGKGYALRQGVKAAQGKMIIYTDIDFPYTDASFMAVYNSLDSGSADVAIGVKDAFYYREVPYARRMISKSLQRMIKLLLRMPVTDTQCGLKGFTVDVKPVFLKNSIDRYLFDLEFVHALYHRHSRYKVAAIPVTLNPGIVFRKMSYKILVPEILNFLSILLKKNPPEN